MLLTQSARNWGSLAPAPGHVVWLDGWRGLCILMVLLGHFGPGSLGNFGPFGVEIFFVLSGRLMAELLVVRRQALPTFIVRRASRILPLLLLYITVVAVGLAFAQLLAGATVNWLSPFASLLFFSNYLSRPEALLQHTWSLAVEEHSYLLLVLVTGLSLRSPRIATILAAALACGMILNGALIFYAGWNPDIYVFWRSDVRASSVLLSFALFLVLQRRPPPEWPILAWVSPACLVAAAASAILPASLTPLNTTACTVFAVVAVNTIEFAVPAYRQLLSMKMLTWLGMLSFSLYIWQQPFLMATKGGVPAIVALPLAFVCAIWSYVRVESPARRYFNRRWGDRLVGGKRRASITAT